MDARTFLLAFAEWLNSGSPPERDEVRALGEQMAAHLKVKGRRLAAGMLYDFTDEEVDDIRAEFTGDHWRRSLTGHTLIAVLQHVERMVRNGRVSVEIIHDKISNFDELLDMARGLFRDDGYSALPGQDMGNRIVTLPTATGLRLADSKQEVLLQAADLLCGYMRDVFARVRSDEPTSTADQAIAHDLIGLLLEFDCWGTNAAQELRERYWALGFGHSNTSHLAP